MYLLMYALIAGALLGSVALEPAAQAQTRTYTYVCPKCGAIYSYAQPGIYKCPSDGWTLNPR